MSCEGLIPCTPTPTPGAKGLTSAEIEALGTLVSWIAAAAVIMVLSVVIIAAIAAVLWATRR